MAAQPGAGAAWLSVVPLERWCEPEEVADVVVFLCSDGASHVIGHVTPIDDGWTRARWPNQIFFASSGFRLWHLFGHDVRCAQVPFCG
jgi:Enoyl-(Acyl carrier protein) reductase